MNQTMSLTGLFVHPVKSCAGQAIQMARITPRGLATDREWMLADPDGHFITARDEPSLVLVNARATVSGLAVSAPGMPELSVARARFNVLRATRVWSYRFDAYGDDQDADDWFSTFLQRHVRLLHIGGVSNRRLRVDPAVRFGFADGYPLLLISEGSLAHLNSRLEQPVTMRNFRPNLVIGGTEPFAEDGWKSIRIGDVDLELMKPCDRCVLTTVDPDTGVPHPEQQPLRTLGSFRRTEAGVMFGQNLVARGAGVLNVGDPVTVLR